MSSMLLLALLLQGFCLLSVAGGDFSDQCPGSCVCKWANGKREADCTNAGFNAVPTHLHHEIQILRMTGNYVRKLGKDVFKSAGLINLQRIFMNNCHVQEVHVDAFKDLKIMVELDLSHNNLTGLDPGTFSGNERLQTLSVSHNLITTLHPFQFPDLRHLKSIDFSHNSITAVDKKAFANLGTSVESVSVNNNELRSLREEAFGALPNLKSLQLHQNPWLCDCRLKSFRDWVVERGLYTYPTSCTEPERLADKLWSEVAQRDFACKPEIHVPQSVVFAQPGANVTLGCYIIGSPMPEAKWVLKGRIVNNNTVPAGSSSAEQQQQQQQQFFIHEEGGLERWFNLTITSVGLESVADYTCVAVNAGGVMEENISLTFEEPEPVGLPGGKKEESNMAIIIGAAAGGFLFVLVLLLLFCCCCCRRRTKQHSPSTPSSSSSSSAAAAAAAAARTPERHGSFAGFADSNSSQRLIQMPDYNSSSTPPNMGSPTITSPFPAQTDILIPQQHRKPSMHFQDIPIQPNEVELREMYSSVVKTRPKAMMVSTSSGQFHSGILQDADHYPDLLNNMNNSNSSSPTSRLSPPQLQLQQQHYQPLNPAALAIIPPPNPPLQFPHQFPHLIHSSRHHNTLPHKHHQQQQRQVISPPAQQHQQVLLSPPAQFGLQHQQQQQQQQQPSYVTLPRQLQPRGSGQHVDWSSFSSQQQQQHLAYDGSGPRTSATGYNNNNNSNNNRMIGGTFRFPPPTIPEEMMRSSSSSPQLHNRDSSGSSEVTLPEDSLSSYCEPFGKSIAPPPKSRDSVASSADSEMGGIMISAPAATANPKNNNVTAAAIACPLHKKQLKGILKVSKSKSHESATVEASSSSSPSPLLQPQQQQQQQQHHQPQVQQQQPPPKTLPKPPRSKGGALDV